MLNVKSGTLKNRSTNRKTFLAITLIAIFAVSIIAPLVTALPGITYPRKTAAYVDVAPAVIGVGQEAAVTIFIVPRPVTYSGAPPYPYAYSGVTVTFTRPDGTTDTFMPQIPSGAFPAGVVDTLGTLIFNYKPNMAGEWSVTVSMPAGNFTSSTGVATYTECTSEARRFTVTEEPQNGGLLNGYPWAELPDSDAYWTWPISSNNREWSAVSGEWLGAMYNEAYVANQGGNWQQYSLGPGTGHILWKTPYTTGGLVGGSYGSISYYTGYNGPEAVAYDVIMNGKIYHNLADGTGFECIDLVTGEKLWTRTGATINCGIHLPGNEFAQGVSSRSAEDTGVVLAASFGNTPQGCLFQNAGTRWNYYDIIGGKQLYTFANVTSSSQYLVDGTPLVYGYYMRDWNPTTEKYNVSQVYCWNLTKVVGSDWPTGLEWVADATGPNQAGTGSARCGFVLSADMSSVVLISSGGVFVNGFNAETGKSIWNLTLPYTNEASSNMMPVQLYGTNNFLLSDAATSTYYCYSALNGDELWSTQVGTFPWNTQMGNLVKVNDDENVYIGGPDGTMTALRLSDGHIVWHTAPINSTEYNSNSLPFWRGVKAAEGRIYVRTGPPPQYAINPFSRFAVMLCINSTTGETIFTLNGGIQPCAISAGYLTAYSQYDGNYYCVAKGKTSTSVTAPMTSITTGAGIIIQGNVLDQSPAQPGTPAVADSSMSEWMDYLHLQNASLLNNPPTPKGVPVTLTALDPNNNIQIIGQATTDASGQYSISWEPPIPGVYTIKASFEGSDSYWSSSAETAINVVELTPASTDSPQTNLATTVDLMMGLAVGVIAIIIAIAIVGVLILRKRP
jgi:outer membrane protein assembly factor BamB